MEYRILNQILNNKSACFEILKKKLKSCSFKVNSYKITAVDEIKGFLGCYYYLLINCNYENKDEDACFFVKAKGSLDYQQHFMNENGVFSKECQFYERLVRDISKSGIKIINDCVPQCYFVSDDQCLIFEELSLRGYVNHSGVFARLDSVKSGLDALANLHASGLIFEEKIKERIGKKIKLSQYYPEIFAESFFPRTKISEQYLKSTKQGAEALIDLSFINTNADTRRIKKLICDVYDSFFEIVKPHPVYANTICHGDLWISNIMYNTKSSHCYLIDFQMVRYGPPAQDFMIYLYLTVEKRILQKHMDHLMEYYYAKLREILEEYDLSPAKLLKYEEFMESCNYYKVFACALAVNHHQVIMLPADVMEVLLKKGTMQKIIFEDRSELIREYWNKDEFYREKMKENITEFRDILIEHQQLL